MSFCFKKNQPGAKWALMISLLGPIISVAFFVLCNFEPSKRKNIPIYVKNDYIYLAGALLLPFFSGYLISLLMVLAPR